MFSNPAHYIAELERVVSRSHNCFCSHIGTAEVNETFQGTEVWKGYVEIFRLTDHLQATICYAWMDSQTRRSITVLRVGPVTSAGAAVRAAIVQESRNERSAIQE